MIIGRSGENVKFIQQRTRAKIQIQTDAETPEGAPARMVYLRGPVDACRNAARMINDMCIGRRDTLASERAVDQPTTSTASPSTYANEGALMPPMQPPSAASRVTPYQATAMHHMEYHRPITTPPHFGQPRHGLYNPPYGAQEQYPMPYYAPQYPMPYYAQLPMMPQYAMEYAQEQRKYYEEPRVERRERPRAPPGRPSPESPDIAREPTTPPVSRSSSPHETGADSDVTMSPSTRTPSRRRDGRRRRRCVFFLFAYVQHDALLQMSINDPITNRNRLLPTYNAIGALRLVRHGLRLVATALAMWSRSRLATATETSRSSPPRTRPPRTPRT